MLTSKAAKRYAKAFFEIAQEKSSVDAVAGDFTAIYAAIEQSEELNAFLKAPLISSEKRVAVLKAALEGKIETLTFEFLVFLVRKKRLDITADVAVEFSLLQDVAKGIQRISITSAFTMADDQVEAVKSRLQLKLNKTIVAEVKVEPTLIGGFKVQVNDNVYDLSVETQLKKLKQSIAKA